METCSTCNGKGQVREVRRSIIGSFSSVRTCEICMGKGKIPKEKCDSCKGRGVLRRESEVKIAIPPGIENGEVIRLGGMGEAIFGGTSGDLYVKVRVRPHATLKREGKNLLMNLKTKLSVALLGGEQEIKTLDGEIKLKIPEGISFGEILRVRGKGIPYDKNKRGDLLVRVNIEIPKKLSTESKKAVRLLRDEGL